MPRRQRSSLLGLAGAAAVVAAFAGLSAPAGRADGDPCSDVLLNVDVCLPVAPTSPPLSTLVQHVALVNRGGYRVKVAVIAGKDDLGSVPSMWGQPAQYAPFLGTELSMLFHGNLLVVMPAGIGFYHDGRPVASEEAALASVAIRSSDTPGLASAALTAVDAVGAVSGAPIVLFKQAALARTRLTLLFGLIGNRKAKSVVVHLVVRRSGVIVANQKSTFTSVAAATRRSLVVTRPAGWGRSPLRACVQVSVNARPSPPTCLAVQP